MHTILVPIEGSDHALKALRIACDLATKYDGKIALLYVLAEGKGGSELLNLRDVKPLNSEIVTALKETRDSGKRVARVPVSLRKKIGKIVLGKAASKVRRLGLEVDILEIEQGDPAECIVIARKRIKASTIVMGSRGVSRDQAKTFGSVSHKVFEMADCTCISVK